MTRPLQIVDYINKRGMCAGLNRSSGLRCGDGVSSRLFDYAEPVEFQLTDDRCVPCTRRTSDDERSHVVSYFRELCSEPEMRSEFRLVLVEYNAVISAPIWD